MDDLIDICLVGITKKGNLMDGVGGLCWVGVTRKGRFGGWRNQPVLGRNFQKKMKFSHICFFHMFFFSVVCFFFKYFFNFIIITFFLFFCFFIILFLAFFITLFFMNGNFLNCKYQHISS